MYVVVVVVVVVVVILCFVENHMSKQFALGMQMEKEESCLED